MSFATLPVPANSTNPAGVWQRAQAAGTTAGSSPFQCLKGSELTSACPELCQSAMKGTSATAVGASTAVAGVAVPTETSVTVGVVGVVLQAARMIASRTISAPETINDFLNMVAFSLKRGRSAIHQVFVALGPLRC